jgi:hypothetical protein
MSSESEFIVVMRAPSAARFKICEGQQIDIVPAEGVPHPIRLRYSTRWVNEGYSNPLPRELWIEAKGVAATLDDAVSRFEAFANSLRRF